ncbi:MAG: hypothetical protein HC933_07035 [Pleurocapsa sp. SU_196_0]|nr:hypothetical protein [Pleurocapsa sp. SU_196_0]
MTLREEIVQKVQTADEGVLERLNQVLADAEETATRYPGLLDVRVKRSPEEIAEFSRLLRELAEPVGGEDLAEFNEAVKRRPLRSTSIEFEQ